MLTVDDLREFMVREGVAGEILLLAEGTPTVADAAAAVGCDEDGIGKSILFMVDGEPLLVIANGSKRVGYKALADYLGVSRRRIKMADKETVLQYTGYPVGGVPPFGHPERLRTIVEQDVLRQDVLYAGGGALNGLVRVAVADLVTLVGNEVVAL